MIRNYRLKYFHFVQFDKFISEINEYFPLFLHGERAQKIYTILIL